METFRRWKDIPCSCISWINIVKMATPENTVYMFNEIPIKITITFFSEIENPILKFMWNHNCPWIAKSIWSKKSNAGITIPDLKLYCRSIVIKKKHSTRTKETGRPMEQTQTHTPTNFWYSTKEPKTCIGETDSLFNKWCWENSISTHRRLN
jgi:hypothetical protein